MDAIDAIRGRRSVRDYLPRPVDRAVIADLIRDATHAPWTPMSAPEPWVFAVIEGAERVAGYGARALRHARDNRPARPGYDWVDNPDFSVFYNAPVVILIAGKIGNPTALEECTRAGQNLVVAAHARGLGACWVGSPNLWLADEGVQAELGIAEGFAPHAAFALGYAAQVPPRATDFEPRITWVKDAPGRAFKA